MFKIGITDDTSIMRCRLIIKLVEICGATPFLIPTQLNINNNFIDFKNPSHFKALLSNHFKKVDEILEIVMHLYFLEIKEIYILNYIKKTIFTLKPEEDCQKIRLM